MYLIKARRSVFESPWARVERAVFGGAKVVGAGAKVQRRKGPIAKVLTALSKPFQARRRDSVVAESVRGSGKAHRDCGHERFEQRDGLHKRDRADVAETTMPGIHRVAPITNADSRHDLPCYTNGF